MPSSARPFVMSRFVRVVCLSAVVVFALLSLVLIVRPTFARQTPQELLQKGDIYWDETSWELARDAYQQALDKDANLPNKAQIEYRIAVALGRANQWDKAVRAIEAYVVKWKDTIWEARGQVWRGRLYRLLSHTGYRVGATITRGSDVPKSQNGKAPVQIDLTSEDAIRTRTAFMRVQQLFERFRKTSLTSEARADLTRDEIDLDFDLARTYADDITWTRYKPESIDWTIDLKQPFDADWPGPKKVMYLYERIRALDATLPATTHHNTVLAALGEAAFVLELRRGWQYSYGYGYEDVWNALSETPGKRKSRALRVPAEEVPYRQIDPIALLEDTTRKYPDDADADRLLFTIATWTEQKGDTQAAVSMYGVFLGRYPKSRWASDAHARLDNLLRPSLYISASQVNRPGQRASLYLNTRNLSQARFTAYRVHPEEVYGHAKYAYHDGGETRMGYPQFVDFEHHWSVKSGAPAFRKEKVAEWTAATKDDGKHGVVGDTVTTPLDSLGMYLIEARAGEHDELRVNTVLLVSDLLLVQKVDKNSVLAYTTEAQTGKPVPNVKLLLWEPVHINTGADWDARYVAVQTDAAGTFQGALPVPVEAQTSEYPTQRQAAAFAMAGPDRYAFTGNAYFRDDQLPVGERAFRAYVTTDRSLYRPKQDVKMRVVMVSGTPGGYQPATGKTAVLVIRGPHGELLRKDIKTGEYGSGNDTFTLPPGADLGDYTVSVDRSDRSYALTYGSVNFRVEEYKKPEYAVTVTPEKAQVRVGEPLNVTISGRYFFGAPVANAKVHYRVARAPYEHPVPVHPRLDWYDDTQAARQGFSLANYSGGFAPNQDQPDAYWANQGNDVYREGDLLTDAQGIAHLNFPTDLPKPPKGYKLRAFNPGDQSYVITAEMVDDSRREVSGVGSARATGTQFHAFLTLDRQFVVPGETLRLDVRARDGSDKPFAAPGYISFIRLIPPIPEIRRIDPNTGKSVVVQQYVPPREENQGKLFVQTDAAKEGLGQVFWHPDTPGDYRLEYSARDAWGNVIRAATNVLVYGPQWDAQILPQDKRCLMMAEHGDYKPGDTARVLLVAPEPDSYALFTEQAVGGIIRYRTIFIPGRSTLIDASITSAHVPNVGFTATLVHDGQVQEASCEIGVPAENRILALQIKPDKAQYKPGEHAVFAIHAVDAQGRPAQGEVDLGVVDQSLLAIQADLAPDIRRFFYGYRIQTQVGGANSVNFAPGAETEVPPNTAYETHELVYPEGMGWLLDHFNGGRKIPIPSFVPYSPASSRRIASRRDYSGSFGGGFGALDGLFKAEQSKDARSDAPISESRILAGRPGSGGPANRKQPAGTGAAAGFLKGVSPQDIFALDADNSLVLRYDNQTQSQNLSETLRYDDTKLVAATVRRLFADTAFWTPAIVTDKQGNATVAFDFPDNLTQWRVTARGVTKTIDVGVEETQTVTKKNLLVRLQAPRFFVDRDQVTISANVHNYLAADKTARIELVTDAGVQVFRSSGVQASALQPVTVAQGAHPLNTRTPEHQTPERLNTPIRILPVGKDGEARVDWTVDIKKAGLTKIKVIAQTDEESDAAEMTFPVLVHGVEKFIARNGVLKDGGNATLTFDLPDLRRKGATLLDVQMSPSLASVMLDALPYLEDYPYGCVEQTTSRFVPTVLVAKTLRDAGIDLETLGKRAKALEEQRRNIPPQQIFTDSGYTYPHGVPGVLDAKEMASRLAGGYHGRSGAPVFDSATLKAMTDAGLQKLTEMQRADGSWGWWQGSALGDPYLTAYVLESLIRAQQADIAVKPEMVNKAYSYLEQHFDSTEDLHLMAYYDYVLCLRATVAKIERAEAWAKEHRFLYERRDRLNAYGQALLALAHHYVGDEEKAGVLVRNLITTVKRDDDRGTAHWESDDKSYWRWYNDKQETTAMCLRALVAIEGNKGKDLPPNTQHPIPNTLAAMSVRWLVDNRRGGYWTSTKQTAIVVEALMEYARAQKELTPDYTVTLDVNGRVQKTYHIDRQNALLFDNRFLVGDEVLTSGGQQLHVTMQGAGTLYYSAYMKYFDMTEPILGQSNAIAVERKYYKVVSGQGAVVRGKEEKKRGREEEKTIAKPEHLNTRTPEYPTPNTRIPLLDGATITSGDIIEVELFLKSDNDYDHLVFEDMKPAGCEAVETRSGVAYGDGLCSNMELRDEKVAFFIDTLPQGTRRLTYRLRAEVPGTFHALPTNAYAMYAPDIRALSDEWRATIVDAPPIKPTIKTK